MKITTVAVWIFIGIIIGTLIMFVTDITCTKTANTELQEESQIYEQEKPYEDDGSGMMMIHKFDSRKLKKGYLQWKKDYPERGQKTVAIGVSGHGVQLSYFILIYKTG